MMVQGGLPSPKTPRSTGRALQHAPTPWSSSGVSDTAAPRSLPLAAHPKSVFGDSKQGQTPRA